MAENPGIEAAEHQQVATGVNLYPPALLWRACHGPWQPLT
jgi:hypothetical protein